MQPCYHRGWNRGQDINWLLKKAIRMSSLQTILISQGDISR